MASPASRRPLPVLSHHHEPRAGGSTTSDYQMPFGICATVCVQHRDATANVPVSALCAFLRTAIGVVDSSVLGSSLITKRSDFSLNTHVHTPYGELNSVCTYVQLHCRYLPTEYNLLSSRICEIDTITEYKPSMKVVCT